MYPEISESISNVDISYTNSDIDFMLGKHQVLVDLQVLCSISGVTKAQVSITCKDHTSPTLEFHNQGM